MKRIAIAALFFVGVSLLSEQKLAADEATIQAAIAEYVKVFNSEDLEAVKSLWSEDAVHTDHLLGARTEGREAIVSDIATVFESGETVRLSGTVDHVRMITDSVASVDGRVVVAVGDSEPSESAFKAVVVKEGDRWVIDSMDETPVPTIASARSALKKIEWLVGSWVDASESTPVRSTVRWSDGGNFMIRTYEFTSDDGETIRSTQIIGWDARYQQIRSWAFHSDGSFGEGLWSQSQDQWLIKSQQTLADGRVASGTYVVTPESEDAYTIQLVGSQIEDELQPPTPAVRVTREAAPAEPTDAP